MSAAPTADGAQAPRPDSTRNTMNWELLCATPPATVKARNINADHSTTGRRPTNSEVGARINAPMAYGKIKAESKSCRR
jgi:hypothetical protein